MKTEYHKYYSAFLGRDAEFKVYGSTGTPLLAFPTLSGRFYDWENERMIAAVQPLIDAGKIQVFCVDGPDAVLFDPASGTLRARIEGLERWFHYITDELVPRMDKLNEREKGIALPAILAAGADGGALNAVNCGLRRPDLFAGVAAMSGYYDLSGSFTDGNDDLVYRTSPLLFLPALSGKGSTVQFKLCCGQAQDEQAQLASQNTLAAALSTSGFAVSSDVWGNDVTHSYGWWCRELPILLGQLL